MELAEQLEAVMKLPNINVGKIKVKAGEQVTASCDSVLMPEDGVKMLRVFIQLLLEMTTVSIAFAEEFSSELDVPKEAQQEFKNELRKVAVVKEVFSKMQSDLQKVGV